MKKYLIVGVIVLAILIIGLLAWRAANNNSPTARIGSNTFKLYVAQNETDKQIGLSKYDKIEDSRGMIFTFDKPDYYSFWMKEMKFPIDIIYIKDDKIVTIHRNVQPPKEDQNLTVFNPSEPADKVLELNAGLSQKYNIKEGDSVKLSSI